MTWIGFGFTVPFGLSTEYDDNWEQSDEGTDAKIEVYDFNPTFAWKLSDKFSLGAGVSYQYVKAKLGFNKSADLGAAISNYQHPHPPDRRRLGLERRLHVDAC